VRVLELSLRNYRVFEQVDLELPARVIGIFGENGSGKSALLESIAFACYGVDAARTKKQEIRTHGVLTDCEVRLAFEHAGEQFEVRRTLKGRGHMPEAELYGGDLLLASGTTEVDAEIRRLLHMDLHVFRASVYAEQKQLDAFSSLRPGERKEMALRLLGIKPVDDARTAARREAKATKESAVQLAGAVPDLAELEAELKEAKDEAAEARKRATSAAQELRVATATAKAARKAFDEADAARQRIETLTVQVRAKTEQRDGLAGRRDELADRLERLAESLAELPALERELEAIGDAEERLRAATQLFEVAGRLASAEAGLEQLPAVDGEAAIAALDEARAALAAAQAASAQADAERDHRASLRVQAEERLARAAEADPSQPCPTCGRPLGEDFPAYVRHCKAELAEAKRTLTASTKIAKDARAELDRHAKAQDAAVASAERAQRAIDRRAQLAEQVEGLRVEVEALAEPFEGAVPDVAGLRARAQRSRELGRRVAELGAQRDHHAQLEQDLASVAEGVGALDRELAALVEEAERLAFDPEAHERLAEGLQEADVVLEAARDAERAAGDASKDAEKLAAELAGALGQAKETAAKVEELRSEARYAERVGMLLDGFRDHLVARVGPELSREAEALFRELTNREYDDLKVDEESLAIQIADGDTYFAIDRFSGSETDLANLALRVAISTHLSRVSGADVGMLVLDEVLASLDEERKDLMVQALGHLSGRFHQLFVITHAERVKDQFPASILVQKTGRRRSVAALV
jgi:DNA repair exonuclease SbcCD ATPase subunit